MSDFQASEFRCLDRVIVTPPQTAADAPKSRLEFSAGMDEMVRAEVLVGTKDIPAGSIVLLLPNALALGQHKLLNGKKVHIVPLANIEAFRAPSQA